MADYIDLAAIFGDGKLTSRVDAALLSAAETIRTELVSTTNHANRLLWVKELALNQSGMAQAFLRLLIGRYNDLTIAQIQDATDVQIRTAVDDVIDIFATG